VAERTRTDQNGPSRDLRNCFRRPTLTKAQESDVPLTSYHGLASRDCKIVRNIPHYFDFCLTNDRFFYELPRILVPPYDERIPVTPYNALMLLVLTFPFFFMAYLTRRPHTYTQRLLLLPIVILCNFRLGFWYYFPNQTTFSVGLGE